MYNQAVQTYNLVAWWVIDCMLYSLTEGGFAKWRDINFVDILGPFNERLCLAYWWPKVWIGNYQKANRLNKKSWEFHLTGDPD